MKENFFKYRVLYSFLFILILFGLKFPIISFGKVKKPQLQGKIHRIKTYKVKKGDNLWSIAKKFGVSVEALKEANNLRGNTLKIGQKLIIPTKASSLQKELESPSSKNTQPNSDYIAYKVKKGDTLYRIAKNFGLSVKEIMEINQLSKKSLKIGQIIKIPVKSQKGEVLTHQISYTSENLGSAEEKNGSENKIYYEVKKGDTLFKIARLYETTVEDIKKLNSLKSNQLKPGQVLLVKIQKSDPIDEAPAGYKYHIVQEGETLYRISLKYNVPLPVLKEVNNLKDNVLFVGQRLKIPVDITYAEAPFVLEKPKNLISEKEDTLSQKFEKNILSKRGFLTPSMLTEEEEEALKQKFLEISLNFADQRYKFGGEGNGYLDCSAFVKLVYEELGIKLPRSSIEQYRVGVSVDKDELIPGDLVFFKTRGKRISHVGIYIGDKRFIHISSSRKRVAIDSLDDPYFKKRYAGAKRVLNGEVLEYFQEYLNKNKENFENRDNKGVIKREDTIPEVNI